MQKEYGFSTRAVHAGYTPDPTTKSMGIPIYPTSAYAFDDAEHARRLFALEESGNIYSRLTNPTCDLLGDRVAALEGAGWGLAAASGHAAITMAILNLAGAGDEIVSARSIYGGAVNLLDKTLGALGIKTHFVDGDNPAEFESAVSDRTKAFFIESIGNPRADIPDISEISAVAKRHGIPLIVDNTVATPYLMNPADLGADIIIHSATKFLTGNGSVLGGVVVDCGSFEWKGNPRFPGYNSPDPSYKGLVFAEALGSKAYITKLRTNTLRDIGACLSPFNAWVTLLGLETLELRMIRHSENALGVAKFLESSPNVDSVCYPALESSKYYKLSRKYLPRGASSVFCFDLKGGRREAAAFCDSLKLIKIVANLGDSKTIINSPALTTHSQLSDENLSELGINPGTIRISVGLENLPDILSDLDAALKQI